MWHSTKNTIPSHQLDEDALDTLSEAIDRICEDFDPRTNEVYTALNYLQRSAYRFGAFRDFREGLHEGNVQKLRDAYKRIKKHMNY